MKRAFNSLDPLSRRSFVERMAKAAMGVSLLPLADQVLAQSAGGKAKHIIYLYMAGGMTHLDTFDPKPGTEVGGKTEVAKTPVPGIVLGQYLPKLAERMNDIAVVRTLQQRTADHRGASYWMRTSYQARATIKHPCMGPWAQRLLGKMHETLPDSVVVGGGGQHPGAGFLGPNFEPLPIGDPQGGLPNSEISKTIDDSLFGKRLKMMETFNSDFNRKFKNEEIAAYNQFYDNALELMKSSDLEVFDLTKETQEKRDAYGMNQFGQGLLLAKRLVTQGIRYVEVVKGGWDMHNDLWGNIETTAGELDQAVAALIDDLKAEGKFDETLIVLTTEFGRSPRINANAGRDHHSLCFSGMLAGGGIKGGQVFGKSDDKGHAPAEDMVEQKDFNATIAMAAGMPLDQIVYSPSGRPFMVAGHKEDLETKEIRPEGKPIMPFLG
ncbi:MAG: DUF1501 domain-containing protein [Verrucomicrobiae bacterium]|nr:DUF1501 domain-containing protein [Verrucomicrobiae bacterium]